jgi:hypothetical protein
VVLIRVCGFRHKEGEGVTRAKLEQKSVSQANANRISVKLCTENVTLDRKREREREREKMMRN